MKEIAFSFFFSSLRHIKSTKFSPSAHLSCPNLSFFNPSSPLPSLWDGHLIHLTSWKDKYSLVECEAPASLLMQTGDEEKVSPLRRAQTPKCLHSNRCRHKDESNTWAFSTIFLFKLNSHKGYHA